MRTAKAQDMKSIAFRSALRENSRRRSAARLFGYVLLAMLLAASGASAQSVTATVAAGRQPSSVAVNPVTNKIYVVNNNSASVTVIDGAGYNTTSTVAVGNFPELVALNPLTNKIYVNNVGDDTLTVIDGASNTTSTVAVGTGPDAIAAAYCVNRGAPAP